MAKVRKDKKGRVLHKGESYNKQKQLYCYAYSNPLGGRRFIYAQDLGELREREKQITLDTLEGIDVYARAKADINFVFDRYISTKTELRSTTMTTYVYTYDRYVRKGFGKKKIADIRYSDVLLFYNSLYDKGLKVNTIDSIHGVLHPTFQMAVRDNIIRNNPSDGVMAELKKKAKGDTTVRHALTLEEERAFLKWIERPEYKQWQSLFIVMFGTGGRIGEIIGLRWEDLNFDENYISINHDVTYYPRSDKGFKCEFRVSLPKTEKGIRSIPMLDKVREVLIAEDEYQQEHNCRCMVELEGMSGFIFSNRFGQLHNPAAINRAIKRIVDDHNAREEVKAAREGRQPLIIPRFSCHITRHTFCSRLCENETNVKVIQEVMGHKDIQTTLDIYAEVSETKRQAVFKELNNSNMF
ncbi:MAG: site-specific integrase [Lachnospiraceae bacterium]|nr:site-specific integrase [Lachnospiraceae bacterium]